jgi:glyoxylase-like metal-dependent hydrolase (beta-lactamase superfamily II)
MTEVTPGINLIKMPLPNRNLLMGYVNIYLVKSGSDCLLIDAGWSSKQALESIQSQLAETGTRFEDISRIVATHFHPDHYSLAGKLRELSGAKIAMHHVEMGLVEPYAEMAKIMQQGIEWLRINGMPVEELSRLVNQMRRVNPEMMEFDRFVLPDSTLDDGDVISAGPFNFRVLWTPGHSPGHICLYEPERKILFSGDHILPTITPVIELHPRSGDNPLDDYLNSLDSMRSLDVRLVLPGHGSPFDNLQSRIEQIIRHHKLRNEAVLKAAEARPQTAYQIANEIPWMLETGGVRWQELAPGDRTMAVSETLAHLESMRFVGKVSKSYQDGIIYYQVA